MPRERGVQTSFYLSKVNADKLLPVLDAYGNRSAGVTRLLRIAQLAGGIEALEELVFTRLGEPGAEAKASS